MPFCPLCKTEYPAGSKRCIDCEVDLVESLDEDKEAKKKLVLLYSTDNKVFAEFLKETLETSKIKCFLEVKGSFLEEGLNYVSKKSLTYKIYVPQKKYEESLIIKEQTVGEL
jgi:hypothetical protein